jgi:tetratricopeptide (TPR) repeat protein
MVLLSGAALASAQDADERARGHFLAGSSYFEEGRYEESATQFMEAYRLSGRTTLLLNAATAYERAQRFDDAASTLQRYLDESPPDIDNREAVEVRIVSVRELADRAEAEAAELEAARQLRQAAAADTADGGDDAAGSDPEAAEGAGSASGLSGLGWAGVASLGVGAGSGIIALATGLVANSRYSDLESACGPAGDACPESSAGDISSGRRMARTSTALTFVGIAGVGAGVVLILLGRGDGDGDGDPRAARVTVDAQLGRNYTGLTVEGSF